MDLLSHALTEERPALIGREGVRIELPDPLFHLLVTVVRDLRAGKAVVLLPEQEAFTTQAAANFLGVSRPFFVALLERGEIGHHRVGNHRRVYLKDLLEYSSRRDRKRRETLDKLTEEIENAGLTTR